MRRGSETLTNITTHIVLLGKPPVLKALFQPIIERPGTKVRVAVPGVFNTFDDKPGGVTSHVCFIHFGRCKGSTRQSNLLGSLPRATRWCLGRRSSRPSPAIQGRHNRPPKTKRLSGEMEPTGDKGSDKNSTRRLSVLGTVCDQHTRLLSYHRSALRQVHSRAICRNLGRRCKKFGEACHS